MANMKIGIIGMGWVGSSVAISTLHTGIATELLVHDLNGALAEGEALDLAQGASFYPTADVRSASIDEMSEADAVVIAAGRGGRADESRLDLMRENATIIRSIAERLTRLRGLLVIVTNPVDIMTRVATVASGLPKSRVIGTGTMLDTARLRHCLGRQLALDPRSIHAHVVGEHGDSEVVLWSAARVATVALRHWPGWTPEMESALAAKVRRAAYEIISRKGATNHAIGLVTAALLESALRDERRVLTVSQVQDGAFGIREVAISLPAAVGREGVTAIIEPEMSPDEKVALERSVEILRQAAALL
jgi:L-lactate dehydrogenase